jgi:hypothetical protein
MRTLAERLRGDLGLPACNILWCLGTLSLLVPDTTAAREAVASFRGLADRWCWENSRETSAWRGGGPRGQGGLEKVDLLLERVAGPG